MAAEMKRVTEYKDRVSCDRLLMPALHRDSLKLSSKPDLDGMMFEVESKMVWKYEHGVDSDFQVINLVARYGLVDLRRINSVGMFDAYMKHYISHLIPRLEMLKDQKEVEFFKSRIERVLDHIRSRFSDFKFYTGVWSNGYLTMGHPFPKGLLVIADTKASDPPTFLYLKHGLIGFDNPNIVCYLSRCSSTGVLKAFSAEWEKEEREREEREKRKRKQMDGDEEEEEEPMEEEEEGEEEEPIEEEEEEEACKRRFDAAGDVDIYKPRPGSSVYCFDPSKGTSYLGGIVEESATNE